MAGISINSALCTGCMNCQTVCSLVHCGSHDPSVSGVRVDLKLFSGIHTHNYCRQCENPDCARACTTGAITRDPATSAWLINPDLCINCKACVNACRYGAVFTGKLLPVPFKCDLCGGNPQCVEACKFNAITYGEEKN